MDFLLRRWTKLQMHINQLDFRGNMLVVYCGNVKSPKRIKATSWVTVLAVQTETQERKADQHNRAT